MGYVLWNDEIICIGYVIFVTFTWEEEDNFVNIYTKNAIHKYIPVSDFIIM